MRNDLPVSGTEKKPFPLRLALILLFNTAVIFGLYCYFVMKRGYLWVFWLYYAITAAAAIGYVVYNRGFSRERLTLSDLPLAWSQAQKEEFLSQRDERKKKSKWLLTILFPLCFTILFDMIYLFFGDGIAGALSSIASFLGIS